MKLLSAEHVIHIHQTVIKANELQGQAPDKSIEAVIERVLNRLHYGQIADVFELAACYATFIAVAHAFNDANKRTAFATMDTLLALNDIELDYGNTAQAGDKIVQIVLGKITEQDLATWLRAQSLTS